MAEAKGVENLEKVINLVAETGNVVDKILNEKSGVAAKFAHLASLMDEVLELKDFSFKELKLEYGDISREERDALVEKFSKKFDLRSDRTEVLIERSLSLVKSVSALVPEIIGLIKNIKEDKFDLSEAKPKVAKSKRSVKKSEEIA